MERAGGPIPVGRRVRAGPSRLRSAVAGVVPVSVVALVLAACGGGGGGSQAGGQARSQPVQVSVAATDTISVEVDAVGTLEAQASAEVASQVDGTVSRIDFREGSHVPTGEVLVQLDASKLEASLQAARASAAQAEAQADNLQRQVQRNRELLSQGAISKQAFDDLQSSYQSAEAQLGQARANVALAREQLHDATIRAPFAGRVGERTFDVGDYVRKGDPLFTVTDDDTLQVRFTVPEQYADRVRTGSAMQVQLPGLAGQWFDGTVFFVSPTVDPQNRTMTVKAAVPNQDGRLRPGASADVRLVLERRPRAIVVPEAAIVPEQGRSFVYRVRAGEAERVPVTVGVRSAGRVEIQSGISAGDTVVTAGQQRLSDGSPVRIEGFGPGVPADTVSAAGTDSASSGGG